MPDSWKSIKELRESSIDISGGFYSEKYAKKHNLSKYSMAQRHEREPSMWIPEMIEVDVNDNSEILYRTKEAGVWCGKQKDVFETSLGTFVSHDCGEFGGELITPKEKLHGNFIEVFECDNIIYAIDSCDHLCAGHIKIYTFSENMNAIKLYESADLFEDEIIYESLSFKGLYVKENSAYILFTGYIEHNYLKDNRIRQEKSYLYEMRNGAIVNTIEFDYWFDNVENIIVDKNQVFIGMDKVVAIVNLDTKEIKAYTPISTEAEEDIIKAKMG